MSEPMTPIDLPYALFVCPLIEIDEQGRRWTDGRGANTPLH